MTAFSRQQLEEEWGSLSWEIRSVNHRYLETSFKLPDSLRALEPAVREILRNKLGRGKVECQLRYQIVDQANTDIELNQELIRKLMAASNAISDINSTAAPMSTLDILKWPGVIHENQFDFATIEDKALSLLNSAVEDLLAARRREGEELKRFLQQRLVSVREIVSSVRTIMPEILARQKSNLQQRLEELKAELEPARLEQEIALQAQKADVDEELDRLEAHTNEVERVLDASQQKGRRLDFLMQELNREANTLSSKSVVAETTLNAVELKVLIEQMREQVQNIE